MAHARANEAMELTATHRVLTFSVISTLALRFPLALSGRSSLFSLDHLTHYVIRPQ
jgi:hypothetical protein